METLQATISRPQRIGLGVAGAGFLLSIVGAVILQIDPSRMLDAHHVLHRTGMAVMLAGLITFLVPSVARRHRERLKRAARTMFLSSQIPSAAAETLRSIGAACMACATAGELLVLAAGSAGRGFFLTTAGAPGLLIWLAGITLAALRAAGERTARNNAPPAVRATPVYREWSETPGEPRRADAS